MSSEDQIESLWPITLGSFINKDHHKIKNGLLNFFEDYEKKNTSKKGAENSNLFESAYDIHLKKNKFFNELLYFISKNVLRMSNYCNMVNDDSKDTFDVSVKDSWFIRYSKEKGHVLPHVHSFCSWCCVYYVQIGEDANLNNGSTYFLNPRAHRDSLDFGSDYRKKNTRFIIPKEGKVLIWPNNLLHGSVPYMGKKERIIVSANFLVNKVSK